MATNSWDSFGPSGKANPFGSGPDEYEERYARQQREDALKRILPAVAARLERSRAFESPGMLDQKFPQKPPETNPYLKLPNQSLPPETEAFGKFLFDTTRDIYGSSPMAPGEGVRLPSREDVRTRPQIMDEDPVGAGQTSGGGRVDVTIDGKTYSYGGGQRGGANGPAPVLDAQLNETSHSGATSGGFGGELRRMGRGPLEIASTEGAGAAGEHGGLYGNVQLSKDSTTPMAEQLREEERKRGLDEILFANRMKLEEQLAKDPLYRERELAKIDQAKQDALLSAQGRSATAARMQAEKMQAAQRIEQAAREAAQRAEEKYATDPAGLERAMIVIKQRAQDEMAAIEARYGAT